MDVGERSDEGASARGHHQRLDDDEFLLLLSLLLHASYFPRYGAWKEWLSEPAPRG
jgi:hypothetical protein